MAAASCKACPLWEDATQTVFGEGRSDAGIMIIGEQPGDEEDIRAKPFVGPAGRLLDRALGAAGIERDQLYVTDAVTHFKWEPCGKRRIHKTPAQREIEACRHWLEAEIETVKPSVIVCLGATAARTVTDRKVKISAERGRLIEGDKETSLLITTHPSSILRTPQAERPAALQALVDELRLANRYAV